MGLRDVFSKAAQTAFSAAGDVPVDAYYYAHATAVYDVSSGTVSTGTSLTVVSMIFQNYSQHELEANSIEPSDQKAMFPQAYLPGVVPSVKDHVQVVEAGVSVRYDVVRKTQDPAGATWELQLRKP